MVFILLGGLTALLCGLDLWCKSQIEEHMQKGEEKPVFRKRLLIRNVHNKGAAFNLCEKRPEYVRVLSIVLSMLVFMCSLFVWGSDTSLVKKIGIAVFLAGAISNTYDRLKRKYVVDYFGFATRWKKLRRLTFNLGDMFIFIGAVCCVIGEFRQR